MRDRHCAHYAAALEGWDEALKGPRQLAALAEVEAEVGNVRAAWDWAVERGYVERLGQGMDGLRRFYEWRGRYEEGEAACYAVADALPTAGRVDAVTPSGDGARPALRRPPSVSRDVAEEVRSRATAWRAVFNRALRRPELAKQLLEESLAQLEALASAGREVRQERAFALRQMGEVLFDLAEYEDARRCYGDSLVTYRALGARWEVASVLHHLGKLLALSGARKKAEVLIQQSLSIRQGLGDHRGVAKSLAELGLVAILAGRMEESEGLTRKSVAAFRVTGDRASIAWGCFYLGNTLIWLGRLAEAPSQLEESVAMHRELRFGSSGECVALAQLSLAGRFLGNYETARASAQMALSLAQEMGYRAEIGASLEVLGMLAITEGQYVQGQQLLQQARSALERSVLGHWASADLGYAVRGLGRPDQARRHIREALCAAIEGGPFVVFLNALPTIALLLADLGESEWAVELYALASRYPLVANAQWYEDIAGKEIAAVAATLPPEIVSAAQERGRARDLEATVQELLAELEG